MKKKLIIALMLALVVTLIPVSAVFAQGPWDVEDPCEFSHEDFALASGYDAETQTTVTYKGEHFPGNQPSDGYSLYRDDATDTGVLDVIAVWLPRPSPGFDYVSFSSPDAWYWAEEPRGYNLPPTLALALAKEGADRHKGLSGVFWVEVFNYGGFDTYKWDDWTSIDRVLAEPVVASGEVTGVNAVKCVLFIPEGTHLSYPSRSGVMVTNLMLELDGGEVHFDPENVNFSQPCILTLAYPDGATETITFTEIRDGLPVPIEEVAPAGAVASSAWIYGT